MPDVNPGTSGLVSWWALDETSGARVDSVTASGNDLTDNNTVGNGTGKQSNAADFELSNSEYLSITDAAQTGLDFQGDFTVAGWVKPESLTGLLESFVCKEGNGETNVSFISRINASNRLESYIAIGAAFKGPASPTATLSNGTWYFLAITYDATAGTLSASVDAGTAGTAATGGGDANDTGEAFLIGASEGSGSVGRYWDGLIDEVCVWSRVLTADERSFLYSAGSGVTYATVSGSDATIPATMHRMIPAGPIRIINASG